MKILCIIDSVLKVGDRWIWSFLPDNRDEVDFIDFSSIWVDDRFAKWGKVFTYYPAYMRLAYRAYLQTQKKKYDVIVAWEGKSGFPYAMLRALIHQADPPLVVLAYNHRGIIQHFPAFTRLVMRSIDHVTVLTRYELETYKNKLALSPRKISQIPLGWYDTIEVTPPTIQTSGERFILASGRSYRDYATLIDAVDGLDIPLVIVARKFNVQGLKSLPNVRIIDFMPLEKFYELLHRSAFLVVPLQNVPHATGDGHIIQAMSAGKAIVATCGASAETYLEDRFTGLLVPPKDSAALRSAILQLWNHPAEAARIGANARKRYEQCFSFEVMAKAIDCTLHHIYGNKSR